MRRRFHRANLYLQLLPKFWRYHHCEPFPFHSGISGETTFYDRGESGIHDSDDRIGLYENENVHISGILKGGNALTGCSISCPPNRSLILLIHFIPHCWRPLLLQHCHVHSILIRACSLFVPFVPRREKGSGKGLWWVRAVRCNALTILFPLHVVFCLFLVPGASSLVHEHAYRSPKSWGCNEIRFGCPSIACTPLFPYLYHPLVQHPLCTSTGGHRNPEESVHRGAA